MYATLFSRDLFADLDRLQRGLQRSSGPSPRERGAGRAGFPVFNLGQTPQSVELFAFAPGLDPESIEVNLDGERLTIAGQRRTPQLAVAADPQHGSGEQPETGGSERARVHLNERFSGSFSRTFSLPDDVDPEGVSARYTNGVLRVSVLRKEAAKPRRIAVNA